ncbi:MAG TPA: hypothetical protein PLG52_05320 [Anaerolineales bacterium]|nr:hypothetical protein [Anaerolineales bacterium]
MKTKIPVWINILQVVIFAILTFQTYACYFNPQLLYPGITVDENSAKMIYVLGGRNAMMAIISVIALVRQNPRFYSFAFLMHSLRDFQDMFIAPLTGGGIVVFFVFLIVFVTPEILSYLKLNKMANEMEKA